MTSLPSRAGVAVLEVTGQLDLFVAPELRAAVDAILDGQSHVCLDVRGVPFMDSTGLAALLSIRRRLRDGGRRLVVVGDEGQVGAMLDQAGLDGLLPRYATLDEALEALPR